MKKLALVTAMALTTSVFALESMTDSALSAATGQDGITIQIDTPDGISIDKVLIHDKDGLTDVDAGLAGNSGAIVLTATKLSTTGTTIVIDADGGAGSATTTANGATLNVNVTLGDTIITTGEIGVDDSSRSSTSASIAATTGTTGYGVTTNTAAYRKILNSMDIKLGGTELNIQLGQVYQGTGAMIKASGTVTGGILVTGFSLDGVESAVGAADAGTLSIGAISIKSKGSNDLTIGANINIDNQGLSITNTAGPSDVILESVGINATSIGDVELQGLDLGDSVIHIRGH